MNITCGQCGKRYKMKAEQTKKAFKTRCKRCSNVIIVRPEDHAESSGASQGASVEAAAPASSHTPAAHAGGAQQAAPQSTASTWYAVINGEQSGPFNVGQLEAHIQSGGLDASGYVWRDGMPNWAPLGEVSELSDLVSRHTTSNAQQPVERLQAQPSFAEAVAQTSSTPEPDSQQALSMNVEIGHDRQVLHNATRQAGADESDLMSSVSYGASGQRSVESSRAAHRQEPQPAAHTDAGLGQLTNQRNENSVLFSLESIDAAGALQIQNALPQQTSSAPVRPTGEVSNTGGTEGSGLIDLSSLSQLTSAPGAGGHAQISISTGVKGSRGSLARSSTDPKSIIVAVLATALVGVLGLVGYQQFYPPAQAVVSQSGPIKLGAASASRQAPTVSPVVANPTPAPSNPSGVTPNPQVAQAASPEAKVSEQSTGAAKKRSAMTSSSRKQSKSTPKRSSSKRSSQKKRSSTSSKRSTSKPRSSSRGKSSTRPSSSSSKSGGEASSLLRSLRGGKKGSSSASLDLSPTTTKKSGPKKPAKGAIKAAMKRVDVAGCISREPSLKGRGTIKVKIVAVSSGAIKSATVVNEPYKSSAVGACIERQVKAQRFPSFTDPDIRFTFPFRN